MTAAEFKKARQQRGLSQSELGHILGTAPQTIRKWEMDEERSTARSVNPVAAQAMRWFLAGFRPDGWPDKASAFDPTV